MVWTFVRRPQIDDYTVASVTDWDAVNHASEGMDATIHLSNVGGDWEQAFQSMVGTRHVFEAALAHGVKRVVFASRGGVHPSSYYPRSITRTADLPTRPDSYYTITKVFGEAMGDMFSARYGIGVVSVRIGNFNKDRDLPGHPHQLSHGDCVRGLRSCAHNRGHHPRARLRRLRQQLAALRHRAWQTGHRLLPAGPLRRPAGRHRPGLVRPAFGQ